MPTQEIYQKAIKFAATKHINQKVPGTDLPYLVHLSNVAMEILMAAPHSPNIDLETAIQLALLHDTFEDTDTTYEELENIFSTQVAAGVSALTKNKSLPKEQQMSDSLARIRQQPKEVGAVKLADRITNLQEPPANWDRDKRKKYQDQAKEILKAIGSSNKYLAKRLQQKIEEYGGFTS